MLTNPQCPDCKTNQRVIASHKRTYHKPGRFKKSIIWTVAKLSLPFVLLTRILTWIVNKFMNVMIWLQSVNPLYQCNTCKKEFTGKQVQKR